VKYAKNAYSFKNIGIQLCHLWVFFQRNAAMFLFLILKILPIDDASLDIYIENGFYFLVFIIMLYYIFYFTSKIRPLIRNYDEGDRLKNSLNMNFIKNIEFLGDFPTNIHLHNKKPVSVYQIEELLENSFEKNIETILQDKISYQRVLISSLSVINIMNFVVVLYDYYNGREVTFFNFIVVSFYVFLMNFAFAGGFLFLFFDYTYAKNISNNQYLLEMIKYENIEANSSERKQKKFPTINFLDVDSLFLWNKLRKWNLEKTNEKKTIFIDLVFYNSYLILAA